MRAVLAVVCCGLTLFTCAWGACGTTESQRPLRGSEHLDQTWGPDDFGYRAKDSGESGGPAVNWIDISGIGTEIQGLADDNAVGPFAIGFSFRYYWYPVTQFWVGSNGYIKFSPRGMLAQPFPRFPALSEPGDVVGPYCADWIFGPDETSRCYYWSNNTDTLIVMWDNVKAWYAAGSRGSHDFELILSGVDSSITFQYGAQTDSVSNNSIAAGIENMAGRLGLSFYYNAYVPSNYAIRVAYPDTLNYVAHDVAASKVQNDISGGFFLRVGDSLRPWMAVQNTGNQGTAPISWIHSLRNSGNTLLVIDSTMSTRIIDPMMEVSGGLLPRWRAATAGLYKVTARVRMQDDNYAGNDSIRAELHVVSLPGELFYDDNSSNRTWSWDGGEGGMAMQFVPPVYPCEITQLRYFIGDADPVGFDAVVYDNGGPGGSPGNEMFREHVDNINANAWVTVTVTPGAAVVDTGSFYVAWMQSGAGVTFGVDTTSSTGISRRMWEYTNTWSEGRLSYEGEAMIRCSVREYAQPNTPPGPFTRLMPADSTEDPWHEFHVTFMWSAAHDADHDTVTYRFRLNSPTYPHADTSMVLADTTTTVTIPIPVELDTRHSFYWRVWARDGHDSTEAGNGQGMFYLTIPDAVQGAGGAVVRDYALSAYPNPFNPVTMLAYDVPVASRVELRVFNLTGERVGTLYEGPVPAGRYRYAWNASGLPSGTYFVQMRAGHVTRLTKVLLLK